MFVIIGAAGKVGYATSRALRQAGVPVRAIVRDATKAERLSEIGCEIAVADLQDAHALEKAIGNADVVQAILPPSLQAKDTVKEMQRAIESLATALEQTKPKRLLAISDYGAHIAHDIGMPTIFRAFEERLVQLPGHKIFLRSAEHMQNWGFAIQAAIASGTLASFQNPIDMRFPTISALDLGIIAADLLLRPVSAKEVEVVHAEGPRRYSANDVATALSELLSRSINVMPVPRTQWAEALEQVVNPSLVTLLVKTNSARNEGGLVEIERDVGEIRYGTTELIDALRPIVPQT